MAYTFSANYLKAQETPPPWLRTPYNCNKPLRVNDLYRIGGISCGSNEIYLNKFRGNGYKNTFYIKPVLNENYSRPGGIGIHSPILEKNDSMFRNWFPYNANWAEIDNDHILYPAPGWNSNRLAIDQYEPLDWPNYTQVDNGIYNGIFEVTSADPTDPDCPDPEPYYFRMYAGPQNFLFFDGPDLDIYGGGSGNYIALQSGGNSYNFPAQGDVSYKCHEFGDYNKVGYDYLNFSSKNLVPLKQFWEKKRIGIRISGVSNGASQEKITLVDFVENCPSGGIGPEPDPDPEGNIAITQSLLACNCNIAYTPNHTDKVAIFKPIVYSSRNIFVVEKFEAPLDPDFHMDLTNSTGCQNIYITASATYNGVVETKTVCLSALKFDITKIQLFFHKLPDTYEIKFIKQDINCIVGGNNGN